MEMTINHYLPGRFRARLTIPGPPIEAAAHHFYDVESAESPKAACETAHKYWCSAESPVEIDLANRIEVFRYTENGDLEAASSFNLLLSR